MGEADENRIWSSGPMSWQRRKNLGEGWEYAVGEMEDEGLIGFGVSVPRMKLKDVGFTAHGN